MKLLFVRHAQSQSNENITILKSITNVSVSLTANGRLQATETGEYLSKYLKDNNKKVKIWNSPYDRTRLTAQTIKEALAQNGFVLGTHYDEEESIHIAERQFGLIDDAMEYEKNHLDAFNHYKLHSKEKKEFFARPPLGESPFDMCQRLDFFLKVVLENEENKQYDEHIIVSHGAAIRGLLTMKLKWKYEKYTEMPNPFNASIHLIDNNEYKGEVFVPSTVSS